MKEDKSLISMILSTLKSRNDLETANFLKKCNVRLESYYYDNWNGGRSYDCFYCYIPLKFYSKYTNTQLDEYKKRILEVYHFLYEDNENTIVDRVEIIPNREIIVDWDAIKDRETKISLISKLEREKQILIDIALFKRKIQETEDEYRELHDYLLSIFNDCYLEHPINFRTIREWYNFYKNNLNTFDLRLKYLDDMYIPLIEKIKQSEEAQLKVAYKKTGWSLIDESISIMERELENLRDRIDYNQIGVRCRETILLLSKEVYIDELHHPSSFPENVGPDDAKRQLDGFIEHSLCGESNKLLREYAYKCNDLANKLTHKKNPTSYDLDLTYIVTISLVNIIYAIYKEKISKL